MSLLPTDLASFAWGALIGGVAAFATGFLKKAGEYSFGYFTNKISPKEPEPIQVAGSFVPTQFAPSDCAWINEVKLYEYEEKGYTYYPHPKNKARCFRITSDGMKPLKEFLLVQQGAKELTSA
jgi:hypothetical protein